jgi:D-cysteine desulfhydrase family pyridoxal phosphate-dependent enzyme
MTSLSTSLRAAVGSSGGRGLTQATIWDAPAPHDRRLPIVDDPPGVARLPPKVSLAQLPTPLDPADRLAAAIGLGPGRLWIKRDDCTGLAGGGNKARKLEYLCAEALARGCDTLVTGGGRQSNHVRMTAAAANKLGLSCTVVVAGGPPPAHATGNLLLDRLLGPEIVWVGDLDYYDLEAAIADTCDRLRTDGRHPYLIPIGGASTTGAMGYVEAAGELRAQLGGAADGALIVVADGSGGTHAGLVAGFGHHEAVLGVDAGTRPDLDDSVPARAAEVARATGLPEPAGRVAIDHDHFGPGYGAPTDGCREALDLAARLEGLILDPVYTGKALAALITRVRSKQAGAGGRAVVFVHTGGSPALFASIYAGWIGPEP